MTGSTATSVVRMEALASRRALETYSTALWARCTGVRPEEVWVGHVASRLHLVLGTVPLRARKAALTTVREAALVYKETSDILHGRMGANHLGTHRRAEWRAAVEAFGNLMSLAEK